MYIEDYINAGWCFYRGNIVRVKDSPGVLLPQRVWIEIGDEVKLVKTDNIKIATPQDIVKWRKLRE